MSVKSLHVQLWHSWPTGVPRPSSYLHATGQPPLGPTPSWYCHPGLLCSEPNPIHQAKYLMPGSLSAQSPLRVLFSAWSHYPPHLLFKLALLFLLGPAPNLTSSLFSLRQDLVFQVIKHCPDATANPLLTESFPPETSLLSNHPFSISATSAVSLLSMPELCSLPYIPF